VLASEKFSANQVTNFLHRNLLSRARLVRVWRAYLQMDFAVSDHIFSGFAELNASVGTLLNERVFLSMREVR
jgi:hypothetical protein